MSSINNFSPFFVAAELRRALNELPDDAVVDVTLVAFNNARTLMYGDYLSKNMNEFVLSRITHSIHQLRSVVAENNRRIRMLPSASTPFEKALERQANDALEDS